MGLVNQTITFTAGIVPTASQWTNQFTTLYNLVNGQLDSANVDKVSSDGIMVLDTAQTRTAALTMSQAGLAFSGAISASAWTTNGVVLKTAAATYTDTSTAGSGTSATAVINSFGIPTLAATNASVTTTDAATVYIAGAPAAGTNQTLTNAYSLWVDAGAVRLDGSLTASGGGSLTGTWSDLGSVTTVDINGGTVDGAIIGGASAAAGTFTTLAGTTSVVAASDITITSGSIISASGVITFGDENLSTTGTLGAGATTVTSLLASSDDVGAIGASGTAFSDLFLASGAVVNFNAGDVTLTHSANTLTFEGGNFVISEADVMLTLNDTSATGSPGLDFQQAGAQKGFIQYQDTGDILEFQAVGSFKFSDYGGSVPLIGVGKTATVPLDLQVAYGSSNLVILDNSTATSPSVLALRTTGASSDNNTQTFLTCDDSTTTRLIIYSDGDVVNHDNSYGAISDESLKENIVDATSKLDDVMSVQIRNFNFVGEDHKQIGVIAQELQKVFPALTEENGDGLLSVKYSVFVPILIKAFQEFVGQTNTRLEALEV